MRSLFTLNILSDLDLGIRLGDLYAIIGDLRNINAGLRDLRKDLRGDLRKDLRKKGDFLGDLFTFLDNFLGDKLIRRFLGKILDLLY